MIVTTKIIQHNTQSQTTPRKMLFLTIRVVTIISYLDKDVRITECCVNDYRNGLGCNLLVSFLSTSSSLVTLPLFSGQRSSKVSGTYK